MIENVIRRISRNKDPQRQPDRHHPQGVHGSQQAELVRRAHHHGRVPADPDVGRGGGKLFRPMALTVIFALAGSLVLSLTAVPVLASFLLPKNASDRDPLPVRMLGKVYAPVLRMAMARPTVVLGGR